MVEQPDNLVLEHLRRIRDDIASLKSEVKEDVGDLKLRVSALEQSMTQGLAGVQAAVAQVQFSMASFHRRADRLETRTDSVEQRLEKVEGSR